MPLSEMGNLGRDGTALAGVGGFASALDVLILECLRFPSGDGSGWWELQL